MRAWGLVFFIAVLLKSQCFRLHPALECAIMEAMKVLIGTLNRHKKGKKYTMSTPEIEEVLESIGEKLQALYGLQQEANRLLIKLKQEELNPERVEAVADAYANFSTINIGNKINDGTLAKTKQSLYSDLIKLSNDIDTHRFAFTNDASQTLNGDFSAIPHQGLEELTVHEVQMKRLRNAESFLERSITLYEFGRDKLKEAVQAAN